MDEYCEWEWISESVSLVDFNLKGIVYEFCRGGRRINNINNYNCNGSNSDPQKSRSINVTQCFLNEFNSLVLSHCKLRFISITGPTFKQLKQSVQHTT